MPPRKKRSFVMRRRLFGSQSESPLPTAATTGHQQIVHETTAVSTDRTLIVGKGMVVAGEIKDCDCLIVEGQVDAEVLCKELKIAPGGLFTGTARVINAEVIGRFEGTLKVTQRLAVRESGRVSGQVRYQQIEIARGGQISGQIEAGLANEPVKALARGQRLSA
jgi:cytoskeletal protein CcmA (bactofilin family)